MSPEPDVTLTGGGSVYLLILHTAIAREWVDAHVSSDRQMLGAALAVEHRFVGDILEGMQQDGLSVDGEPS
jgi:hypothetical protein